ncbi:hypothetical protein HCTV-15_gp102 [Haloarcula virus HCTV-15]|nr:hypothetical protein HCTV-6_gp102 [Haloarcula virus HCTV-6]UBF22576.1 hypothetical protein HCTV-15_gp102 [Haloarcula virus HCTV-15]
MKAQSGRSGFDRSAESEFVTPEGVRVTNDDLTKTDRRWNPRDTTEPKSTAAEIGTLKRRGKATER